MKWNKIGDWRKKIIKRKLQKEDKENGTQGEGGTKKNNKNKMERYEEKWNKVGSGVDRIKGVGKKVEKRNKTKEIKWRGERGEAGGEGERD